MFEDNSRSIERQTDVLGYIANTHPIVNTLRLAGLGCAQAEEAGFVDQEFVLRRGMDCPCIIVTPSGERVVLS